MARNTLKWKRISQWVTRLHHFRLNCLNVLTVTFRLYAPSLKRNEVRCLTILGPLLATKIEVNRDNLSRVELVQQRAFVLGQLELKILRILALSLQDKLTLCEFVRYLYGISFDKQSAICCVLFCTHCVCVAESQLVYVVIFFQAILDLLFLHIVYSVVPILLHL